MELKNANQSETPKIIFPTEDGTSEFLKRFEQNLREENNGELPPILPPDMVQKGMFKNQSTSHNSSNPPSVPDIPQYPKQTLEEMERFNKRIDELNKEVERLNKTPWHQWVAIILAALAILCSLLSEFGAFKWIANFFL